MRKMLYRKKNLLILFCVTIAQLSSAQHQYIPIPEDSVTWVIVDEDWHEGVPGPPPHTFSYRIYRTEGKDTIINSKRYFGGFMWDNSFMPPPPAGTTPVYFGDWLRQDTAAKKIWFVRDHWLMIEELIYDFSLKVGDTITDINHYYFTQGITPYKAWVDQIDSVFWQDGTWRYRWFIRSNYGPAWGAPPALAIQIEGMGYTTDIRNNPFLKYGPLVSKTSEVTCFRLKNQWLYTKPNPWNADCNVMITKDVLGIDNPNINELEHPLLYPNPLGVDGRLTLSGYSGRNDELLTINAYNTSGKLALSAVLQPGKQIHLAEYSFSPGLYFFFVVDKNHHLIHKQKILLWNK